MVRIFFVLFFVLLLAGSAKALIVTKAGDYVNWQVSCVSNNGSYDAHCVRVKDAVAIIPNGSTYKVNFTEFNDLQFPGVWRGNWSIPKTPALQWRQFYNHVGVVMYLRNNNGTNGTLSITFTVVNDEWASVKNISEINNNINDLNVSIQNNINNMNTSIQSGIASINQNISSINISLHNNQKIILDNINTLNLSIFGFVSQTNTSILNMLYNGSLASQNWNYNNRTLTEQLSVNTSNLTINADAVWNYPNRTLTDYRSIARTIYEFFFRAGVVL